MTSFLNTIPKKVKTTEQLICSAKQSFSLLIGNAFNDEDEKMSSELNLSKCLSEIKTILMGDNDHPDIIDEEKVREATRYIQSEGLLVLLIDRLEIASFESRKDTVAIFNHLIRRNVNNFVSYVLETDSVLKSLVNGYIHTDSALSCGSMLRECIRHESLAKSILNSDMLWLFFDKFVHLPNFDVASDAFNTMKDLITTPKCKQISSEFLETHFDLFLTKYEVSFLSFLSA